MPELVDVEGFRRVAERAVNRRIDEVRTHDAGVLRGTDASGISTTGWSGGAGAGSPAAGPARGEPTRTGPGPTELAGRTPGRAGCGMPARGDRPAPKQDRWPDHRPVST